MNTDVKSEKAANTPSIEVFKGPSGKWAWHLIGRNNEIICVSETYASRQGAIDTASRLAEIASAATLIVSQDSPS